MLVLLQMNAAYVFLYISYPFRSILPAPSKVPDRRCAPDRRTARPAAVEPRERARADPPGEVEDVASSATRHLRRLGTARLQRGDAPLRLARLGFVPNTVPGGSDRNRFGRWSIGVAPCAMAPEEVFRLIGPVDQREEALSRARPSAGPVARSLGFLARSFRRVIPNHGFLLVFTLQSQVTFPLWKLLAGRAPSPPISGCACRSDGPFGSVVTVSMFTINAQHRKRTLLLPPKTPPNFSSRQVLRVKPLFRHQDERVGSRVPTRLADLDAPRHAQHP